MYCGVTLAIVETTAVDPVKLSNLVSLDTRPFINASGTKFAPILTVPPDIVKPLEAVNVLALVIVFDDKAPEFVIDADDKEPEFTIDPDVIAPVLVIVFDVILLVLLIELDCNVLSVLGPKTFKELVMISSDFKAFETNEFLLKVCGITLFGNSIEGYEAIIYLYKKIFL